MVRPRTDNAMLSILPLTTLGEIAPRDDLGALLAAAISDVGGAGDADILVVTQKIVSKSEGRFVDLRSVAPSLRALELAEVTRKDSRLVELVLQESAAIVRAVPHVLITRHRLGFVMANAGIDQSNLGPGKEEHALLLPKNPDHSAAALRQSIELQLGVSVAVVITDSFGRPWRQGIVPVAIGAAGIASLHDRRGEADRDGRLLGVTQVAIGDLVAAVAGLVTGEGAGVPAALIRGLTLPQGEHPASVLIRPFNEDLFP